MRTESLPAPAPPGAERCLRGLLHDLGHGLAAVSYLAEGMRADGELPPAATDRLDAMSQELARLLDLVASGAVPAEPAPVELHGLLGRLATARARADAPTPVVRPGAPVAVRADATAVWRMLSNLLDNAMRAAGPGGVVELGVTCHPAGEPGGGTATVEIVDDGPGFGRGPDGAAGLGLGIVTGLAQECGARLHLDPAPLRGTRARLVFPAA
ncbi:HAMP domain-containing sensor histidine kinase [Saccharopolyspora sp. NFXS83]|uniref:sensor histidine kinase n=1 Tax=Saccharopolyspora sp. NFXS83 TaxID=2993560 RepID=UPI00224B6E55|nr:HAMP domain-containing sensor histidine kinase [Saccharopolyspora sp. NFXS83]MCX2729994.1 HAMP domain-containing sensor histidine kinase [Saccharopolyspora sp. NFXS83]